MVQQASSEAASGWFTIPFAKTSHETSAKHEGEWQEVDCGQWSTAGSRGDVPWERVEKQSEAVVDAGFTLSIRAPDEFRSSMEFFNFKNSQKETGLGEPTSIYRYLKK